MRKIIMLVILSLFFVMGVPTGSQASAAERFTVKWLDNTYDQLSEFEGGVAKVWKNGKPGFIDRNGNEITPFEDYLEYEQFEGGLIRLYKGGKVAFSDKEGNIVIPYRDDPGFSTFKEGVAFFSAEPGTTFEKPRLMDKDGKEIIFDNYDRIEISKNGFFRVVIRDAFGRDKSGYINKYGMEVVPPVYDYITEFSEGLALAKKGEKITIIDIEGNTIATLDKLYVIMEAFSEGRAQVGISVVENNKRSFKFGFIDTTGKEIIPTKYHDILPHENDHKAFRNGFAKIRDHNFLVGFIDIYGNEIVPCIYDEVRGFSEGRAAVRKKDGKFGYIDETGKLVIPHVYTVAEDFKDGFAKVSTDFGENGIIDKEGRIILPLEYTIAKQFNKELLIYSTHIAMHIALCSGDECSDYVPIGGGRYGLADKTGKPLTSEKYTYIDTSDLRKEILLASLEEGYVIINSRGEEIFSLPYEDIRYLNEGTAWVKHKGKIGILTDNEYDYKEIQDVLYSFSDDFNKTGSKPLNVKPIASNVLINNKKVLFDAYTIDGSNYFKLRDLAFSLRDTEKKFDVVWDSIKETISLVSNTPYTIIGGEMIGQNGEHEKAIPNESVILIDGREIKMISYTINGNNYFKLRDIGQVFDFSVNWDGNLNTISIDTMSTY